MRKFQRIFLCVTFVCAGLCNVEAAQMEGANQISLRAGASFPTSINDFNDSAKTGIVGGVQYLKTVSDRAAIGVQADYFTFPGKDRTIVLSNGRLNAESDSTALTAELVGRYSLRGNEKLSPYFVAGIGVARFSQETKGAPQNGTTWANTGTREKRTVADDSSTGIAASFGMGVERLISSRIVIAFEAGWQVLGVDNDDFGTDFINVPSAILQIGTRF